MKRTLFLGSIFLFVMSSSEVSTSINKNLFDLQKVEDRHARIENLSHPYIPDEIYLTEFQKKQINCLARNIYYEARNQSEIGQIAVAHVTLNRRDHEWFPNRVCSVVYQPNQFSWTIQLKHARPKNEEAWELALEIAKEIYLNSGDDPTDGATFYHTHSVNPRWNREMEVSAIIDDHIFYFWNGEW